MSANAQIISSQVSLSWGKALALALKSIRKRFMRSLITMLSVVLAIAFLMSIWVTNDVVKGLVALKDPVVTAQLIRNSVDIQATGPSSKVIWLVVLSLLVCSVGIVNAMLMSVTERFKEIGTMKCLGAMDHFIIRLFLIEAGIQGAIGTIAGIVMGFVVGLLGGVGTYGWVAATSLPLVGVLESAGISLAIGVSLCVVFAIYPAYVAASMQPVDAMRVEE